MKMPIKIRILLWYLSKQSGTEIYNMPIDRARESVDEVGDRAEFFLDYRAIKLFDIKDKIISGRNGDIPIRIYRPSEAAGLPVIVYFHGGGFVINSIDSHDKVCRRISRDNQAVVISVDYRLAPEHPFPAGLHDAFDATVWAAENQNIHTGDPSKLVVMGDSAGANLATVVCQMFRDSDGPKIKRQVLIYPCTDATLSHPSIDEFAEGYLLTKKVIQWFTNHYIGHIDDYRHPHISPLYTEDLSNLPPAFICTAQYDPLKDEGQKYAERLTTAGNEVKYKDYAGLIHGFFGMPRLSKHILNAHKDVQLYLQRAFE